MTTHFDTAAEELHLRGWYGLSFDRLRDWQGGGWDAWAQALEGTVDLTGAPDAGYDGGLRVLGLTRSNGTIPKIVARGATPTEALAELVATAITAPTAVAS